MRRRPPRLWLTSFGHKLEVARPRPSAGLADVAPSEGLLVLTVALSTMLGPLNSTMIAVSLPSIADELGAGAAATG